MGDWAMRGWVVWEVAEAPWRVGEVRGGFE